MLLIHCPYCQEDRAELEFHAAGEAHIARPENIADISDEAFAEYFFLRDNPKGYIYERWRHQHGCGRFFNAVRDTVTDLVKAAAPADADAIVAEVTDLLKALPADTPTGPDKHYGEFSNLDQAIQQEHTDGLYALAAGVGERMTSSPERLSLVVGPCATKESDDACLTAFIKSFGPRALRRPITDEDVACLLAPGHGTLTPQEEMAVEFIDLLSADHHAMDDEFYKRLGEHFTAAQIIELGFTCAGAMGLHRFIHTLNVYGDSAPVIEYSREQVDSAKPV